MLTVKKDIFKKVAEKTISVDEAILLLEKEYNSKIKKETIIPLSERQSETMKFPMTEGQKGLWVLQKYSPDMCAYNIPIAFRCKERFDLVIFEKACRLVLEQHPLLKVNVKEENGETYQYVNASGSFSFSIENIAHLEEENIIPFLKKKFKKPFDLEKDPLVRFNVFTRSKQEHIVLITVHHIVFDGLSVSLFLGSLWDNYNSIAANRTPVSKDQVASFQDFVKTEQSFLSGTEGKNCSKYWQERLSGELPIVTFPLDYTRPSKPSFKGETYEFVLDSRQTEKIRLFSKQQRINLSTILLGILKVLLFRYTGQRDIPIGMPTLGRSQKRFENIIGYFVNMIVIRSELSDSQTFIQFLKQLQLTVVDGLDNSAYPFPKLVRDLKIKRQQSTSALFQIAFTYQNFLEKQSFFDNTLDYQYIPQIENIEGVHQEGEFEFELEVFEKENIFELNAKYHSDLFDLATIQKIADHYLKLLDEVIDHPDFQLSEFDLILDEEKNSIFNVWNHTQQEYPNVNCIHTLFEQQVQSTPNNIAAQIAEKKLTFRELNEKSHQLAIRLQKMGVKPDDVVGLCLERSLEMIIGMLGILKAGGAYLPLDPTYPIARLEYMLKDSGTKVVLTTEKLSKEILQLLHQEPYSPVLLDQEWQNIEQEEGELRQGAGLHNLAYVIYTSGSTGKPKGAMIEHRAICNRILWMQEKYKLDVTDVVLQKTPFSFDVSVWEFFWPTLTGAKLVFAMPEQHKDAWSLAKLIEREKVTTLHFVPSMLKAFLSTDPPAEQTKSIKRIFCSGEALEEGLKNACMSKIDAELHNLYGPTEAAVDVTYWACQTDYKWGVPIGRPIANIQIHILNNQNKPVPIGVPGELHIAGVGLARGYLNNEALTKEKFIESEYFPGTRLYKTGDLARWLPDGNIQYLGRIDHQVKIRGFRIECGEIESALNNLEEVNDSVVLVHKDKQQTLRLVAYIVTGNKNFDAAAVKDKLLRTLPDYMIPSTFITLASFPISPNGKLDRKALPDPSFSSQADEFIAPSSPTELLIAQIWSDLLGIQKIGIDDNYFEMGGDSILTIQIISKINQNGFALRPNDIVENQTIRELAKFIENKFVVLENQEIVIGDVPLTPIQKYFFQQNLVQPHHWNQVALVDFNHAVDLENLNKVLKHLLLHHDALRLGFQYEKKMNGGKWSQYNHDLDEKIVTMRVDLSNENNPDDRILSVSNENQASLSFEKNPLLRAVLFDKGLNKGCQLLIVLHHLIVDGISWQIIVEDIKTLFQQTNEGRTLKLPAKTTSFKRWAELLESYAQSEKVEKELHYWQSKEWNMVKSIPVDITNGDNFVENENIFQFSLSATETKVLLKDLPKKYHIQINEVLLTALARTLMKWEGGSTFSINLEGHGREDLFDDVNLSRTVGWFTSIFPVFLNLNPEESIENSLYAVKKQLREIPYSGVQYGLLRYLNRNPKIQSFMNSIPKSEICLNYLGELSKDSSWSLNPKITGSPKGGQNRRNYVFDINVLKIGNRLEFNWLYSNGLHYDKTLKKISEIFLGEIQNILQLVHSENALSYLPSDFQLINANEGMLKELSVKFSNSTISSLYPLFPMQKSMLYQTLKAPAMYTEQFLFDLKGSGFQPEIFKEVWQEITAFHPALRTAFFQYQEETCQVIVDSATITINEESLLDVSDDEKEKIIQSFLSADRKEAFNPFEPKMSRLKIFNLDDDHYVWIWSFHHLILDGWSISIILSEFFRKYRLRAQKQEFKEEKVYSLDEHVRWLKCMDTEKAQQFWKDQLRGFKKPLPLEPDWKFEKHASPDEIVDCLTMRLSVETTAALNLLAKQNRITVNLFVDSVWALILSRITGEKDIVYGKTSSSRSGEVSNVDKLVGMFANTIPFRVQIDPDKNLLDWLFELQTLHSEIRDYEAYPLEQIRMVSEVPQDLPLFESNLVFQNFPSSNLSVQGLQKVEIEDWWHQPLKIDIFPEQELTFYFRYHRGRIQKESVSELLAQMKSLLENIAVKPDQRLKDFLYSFQAN